MDERWWELVLETEPAPEQTDTLPPDLVDKGEIPDQWGLEFRSYV